jgi:acyl dehydratase
LPFFVYQIPIKFEGVKMAINYGLDKVRFINPVVTGAKIRDRIVISALEERPDNRILMTQTHTIEIEGQEKPACVAQALFMIFL